MYLNCDDIEKWAVANPDKVQELVTRFEQLDSTLSCEELAKAYVAQAYVGGNGGYTDIDFSRMAINAMMGDGAMEEVLRLAWTAACRNPFNLDALDALLRIVPQEHDIWKVAAWRFSRLLKAIASTGDGTSQATAFCVICVQDEYMLMRSVLEIENFVSQELIIDGLHSFDRISVEPSNLYPYHEVFFDITPFNITAL